MQKLNDLNLRLFKIDLIGIPSLLLLMSFISNLKGVKSTLDFACKIAHN